MNSILEVIKKISLFLFGVILIVWGYRANAATNKEGGLSVKDEISPILKALEENLKQQQEARQTPKTQKKEEPVKDTKASLPVEGKKEEKKEKKEKEEKKVESQTVIEKEKPEESSGTE